MTTEISLNKPAGVLIKTTCVDFPGMLAGSFFLKGCNLRCPYCYNTGLVLNNDNNSTLNTIQELFLHLEKRQGILKGVVISGGEPLLNPYTKIIIKKAKELGYKVKIDTNGTLPDQLEELLEIAELKPDFIAMDIKTSPDRYRTELCNSYSDISDIEQKLYKSAKLISTLSPENREFRTVLVPGLVKKEDIKKMADLLPRDASWQFAQFRNGNCLNPDYNYLKPYTDQEIKELIEYAKNFVQNSVLR